MTVSAVCYNCQESATLLRFPVITSFTFLGLTINFFSTDYDVSEEDLIVTIEMTVRETQIPFTLTLTPTTTDDVLADTRLIATDYLSEAFTTLTEAGKATPGKNT